MLQYQLFVRLRKAVEQLGLFGGQTSTVKPHVRHTASGKVVAVKRHQRKRAPLTAEEVINLRRKQALHTPLSEEEQEQLAQHQAFNRQQRDDQKAAHARLYRDGLQNPKAYGEAVGGWKVYPETDPEDAQTWLNLTALHPDGQVKLVLDGRGRATLFRREPDDTWHDLGVIPDRSNARLEAELTARDVRRQIGPRSEHERARVRAERAADGSNLPRVQRWLYDGDRGWVKTWSKAKERLRYDEKIGEVRFRRNVTHPADGVTRVEVEVYRHADGVVVGKGIAVDSTGREPDGTAALWQLPNGADVETPDGKRYRLEWGDLDRTPGEQMSGKQVLLRPIGHGSSTYIDATTIVKRLDTPEAAEELTATAALSHAVQHAMERSEGITGEALPAPPWPPKPSRGNAYGPEEFRTVLRNRVDAPEIAKITDQVQAWERKMRREIGDYAFERAMQGFASSSFVPDPRQAVINWRDSYQFRTEHIGSEAEKAERKTPEAIEASWKEFAKGYQDSTADFLKAASDTKLYERTTSGDYIAEKLIGQPDHVGRFMGLAKHLLELRGHGFGGRHSPIEWFKIHTVDDWHRLKHMTRPSDRAPLVLQNEGGVRSAKSANAVEAYKAWRDRLAELGDNPHEQLVEKNRWGEWSIVHPLTGERMSSFKTRRVARERMLAHLQRTGDELARAAGTAAVEGPTIPPAAAAVPAASVSPHVSPHASPPATSEAVESTGNVPGSVPAPVPASTTATTTTRKIRPVVQTRPQPAAATTATTTGGLSNRELLAMKGHELESHLGGPHDAQIRVEQKRREDKRAAKLAERQASRG